MNRVVSRALIAVFLSVGGVLAGTVPLVELRSATVSMSDTAYAQQDITPEQVRNYARSVQEIEEIRRVAYAQIRNLSDNGEVPSVSCHQESNLRRLTQSVRDIVVEYCTQSVRIVERNNLTVTLFNTITATQQEDSNLASRIQEEIRRLQAENQSRPQPQTSSSASPN
jgi:hypothetical protein